MIKLLNVTYHYTTGECGVDGVSFEIQAGEFILLVGKTGAGKTTIFKLISRELDPDFGEIFLNNLRSSEIKRSRLRAWRRYLGIVFQDLRLLNDRTALDNVRLTATCERNLSGRPKTRALKSVALVGMSHKLHEKPSNLSIGEQQRIAIARALVNEPFILLADEPISNLDGETSSELIQVLKKINHNGTAVVVATHQPERFESCKPRLIGIERGRIVHA